MQYVSGMDAPEIKPGAIGGPGWAAFFAGLIAWIRRVDAAEKLTRGFLFHESWPGTAWRTLSAFPELSHINFELRDGAAESIPVHPEFARGTALVASVFLEDGQYKALLEFTYRLGIKNVALVHLHNEGFELIFHGGLSFFQLGINAVFK